MTSIHEFTTTDFRSLLDKKRFEEQTIDGQSGFYDKTEQVFVPENVFANLLAILDLNINHPTQKYKE